MFKFSIHIRRTDKINSEAPLYTVESYMKHAEGYFDFRDLIKPSGIKKNRVVYLATDDLEVVKEVKTKYPNYVFKCNEKSSEKGNVKQRYSPESIEDLIKDIHVLSKCEFFIGTFSSQIGRLVYELMQTNWEDASWRFRSLDSVYFYGGNNQPYKIAIYDHFPLEDAKNVKDVFKKEIEIRKNDLIEYYPEIGFYKVNLWNGFTFGKNVRTGEKGIFPSYKVKEVLQQF